jgi:hypothetical protein
MEILDTDLLLGVNKATISGSRSMTSNTFFPNAFLTLDMLYQKGCEAATTSACRHTRHP